MTNHKNLIILLISGFIFSGNIFCMQENPLSEEQLQNIHIMSLITQSNNIDKKNSKKTALKINSYVDILTKLLNSKESIQSLNLSNSLVTEEILIFIIQNFKNLNAINVSRCENLSENFIIYLKNFKSWENFISDTDNTIIKIHNLPEGRAEYDNSDQPRFYDPVVENSNQSIFDEYNPENPDHQGAC
ncbi:MAG: hypothetical protein WC436_04665 [Candidatus Babeliales bacterium]